MIASPCVKICQMDPAQELCIGCHRTLDEIARWPAMTEIERRSVLEQAAVRGAATVGEPLRGS